MRGSDVEAVATSASGIIIPQRGERVKVKKQSCGLYRTKIKIGVDGAGRPVYKWLSSPTRQGIEEEKRRARAYYIEGTGLEDDQLFGVYAGEWFAVRKAPHLAPGTKAVYRSALNKRILPAFGDLNLRAIRPMDIQRFVNGMEGMSGTTIHTVIAALRGIFASALQDRLISSDPTTGLQRPRETPPGEKRALTPEERERCVEAAKSHPDGLFLALLYWLGLRSGEARGLKWGDVDWIGGWISVERDVDKFDHNHEGDLKTPGSARRLPVPAPLMDLLRARRGMPGAYIVQGAKPGQPMSAEAAGRRWSKLREAAGLPKEVTPHWLRHNYITMCGDAGLRPENIMYLAGHTSYQTTLRYTHITEERMDELKGDSREIFAAENKVVKKLQ